MLDRRQLRRAIPRPIRQVLYERSEASRQKRWRDNPGTQSVPTYDGIVLTFDDGPDDRGTPQVLDALSELKASATFFVLGEQVLQYPDVAREVVSRGHEIALHGMVHKRHDALSRAEAERELSDGSEAIESTVQCRPRWYRPPFGRPSPELVSVCQGLDLKIVYWTAWGQDWEPIAAPEIAQIAFRDLGAGSILLLHDSARHNERDNAQPTVEALPIIAEWANSNGLPLTSLGAALDGAPH
jgi:peptidoglycan/xylan/chitin deacetylase (PgdA/CDA1 family)